MIGSFDDKTQGDLPGSKRSSLSPEKDTKSRRAGVRASIVAKKPGNSGGAKGRRKVETR